MNSRILEREVFVGANCHISKRVTIKGNLRIEPGTLLGSGAVIRNGIEFGENSIVNMVSVITESLPPNSRYRMNS